MKFDRKGELTLKRSEGIEDILTDGALNSAP